MFSLAGGRSENYFYPIFGNIYSMYHDFAANLFSAAGGRAVGGGPRPRRGLCALLPRRHLLLLRGRPHGTAPGSSVDGPSGDDVEQRSHARGAAAVPPGGHHAHRDHPSHRPARRGALVPPPPDASVSPPRFQLFEGWRVPFSALAHLLQHTRLGKDLYIAQCRMGSDRPHPILLCGRDAHGGAQKALHHAPPAAAARRDGRS
mmetsp:Transcript_60929/g.163266  ORF Transcript_60929/g.163266 Transcript_60929/m.163266 type:complete len:203 (+) Transcript_60929:190-798(+)